MLGRLLQIFIVACGIAVMACILIFIFFPTVSETSLVKIGIVLVLFQLLLMAVQLLLMNEHRKLFLPKPELALRGRIDITQNPPELWLNVWNSGNGTLRGGDAVYHIYVPASWSQTVFTTTPNPENWGTCIHSLRGPCRVLRLSR